MRYGEGGAPSAPTRVGAQVAGIVGVVLLMVLFLGRLVGWWETTWDSAADAERVMSAFSGSLRDEVDPDQVLGGRLSVVNETMKSATVGVWLRVTN